MSKGSKPRPVNATEYAKNFDSIFGPRKTKAEINAKRLAELRDDLEECKEVIELLDESDVDYHKIKTIIELINDEIDSLS